jgi:hypothetical protein
VAARERGIEVYLTLGTSRTSETTPRAVYQSFEQAGVSPPWLLDSPIIPYGRASDSFPASELTTQPVENFSGPCNSLTEHPTIQADGKVTGCAVVFARECSPLEFGSIHDDSLGKVLDAMNEDMLATWIHRVGVVELKRFIEANTSISFPERYVNICHLCGDILSHPEALEFLNASGFGRAAVPDSTPA